MTSVTKFAAHFSNISFEKTAEIRHAITEWLQTNNIADSLLFSVEVAIGEIATNAVKHGHDQTMDVSIGRYLTNKAENRRDPIGQSSTQLC